MITMTAFLNDFGPVAHTQGFFQNSMYGAVQHAGPGRQVACGSKGAGGDPALGVAAAYTVRARDSANLGSANYGRSIARPTRRNGAVWHLTQELCGAALA